ncbi:uncharacterized protein PHACADRAFT_258891 [Phanerochaete carnosa HHB-10118-sp]|uniref:Uncharacterized protein n=1 Tax=Phanerochaete carnosa (strain HHB-10118-sp) TaxID=650164 RepID=K5WWI2_PHACS|nr:uncharacterized protein PHACADRAFT_258891 [Phanerochaete carnosa HHB-10118-sp]EKM54792.1 hypothetical protein PHACADRAFT_258891 [Phanerochaete carnosa HHB-10118-sp]
MDDVTRADQSVFQSMRETTFLRPSQSLVRSMQETQDTTSFGYSQLTGDASDASVVRFPAFHFSLHSLSSLAALEHSPSGTGPQRVSYPFPSGKRKVNLLVAVLELEGPDTIRIKKGTDAGKEVSILRVIVGDQDGGICRLAAWREVAEQWGGAYADSGDPSLKKGDIVYFQNILVSKEVSSSAAADTRITSSISLTASPALNSSMSICYRTMPWGDDPAGEKLRPDLRLGYSDAAVRKVASVVQWFQSTAGLPVI